MKILFVCRVNSENRISQITFSQGESLKKVGIDVHYFSIKGKGFFGYLKNIIPLRKHLRSNRYDIVHAHYSLSSFMACLSGAKPLIASLMGSDVKASVLYKYIIYLFYKFFWDITIVKSEDMKNTLGFNDVKVIPNGVDFEMFRPIPKIKALRKTGWNNQNKHVLFAANPHIPVKNYSLAKEAFHLIGIEQIEMHYIGNVPNKEMVYYFNAADVVLLTSFYEGSPNVIKEAMACCRPIVATDVGDVKEVIANTPCCYTTITEASDIATKIKLALGCTSESRGRENIKHLASMVIASRLKKLYSSLLTTKG